MGCRLKEELGTTLRRVGTGRRLTFAASESKLTAWIAANAAVAWIEVESPWRLESHLLRQLSLPLNIDKNAQHPFCRELRALRAGACARARSLPIVDG